MIQSALRNPFLAIKVDDTATLPPGDVPELHESVPEKCRLTLAQAQESGQSIGLLVIGEAGSGKSHLIARLRKELATNTRVVPAAISLRGAFAGRLWRHLRACFVAELLRPYPESDGRNGLLRILHNRFPKWCSAPNPEGGFLRVLGVNTKTSLQVHLDEFAKTCRLDYPLQKVLSKLDNPQLLPRVHAWLRGQQLEAADLAALGLPAVFPSEQEQETMAREVVLSLFRLAGTATTLFLCFDEVEAIQAGSYDAASLRQFTTLVTDLLAETGPRVVATFIRPNLHLEAAKVVEHANLQKLGQERTALPIITWEQAVRLTKARLEAEPTCRSARLDHPQHDFWPLSREFLEKEYKANKRRLTPRHLIRACAVEFQRIQKEVFTTDLLPDISANGLSAQREKPYREQTSPSETKAAENDTIIDLDPITAPPSSDDHEFVRMWEKQRKKYLKQAEEVKFDRTLAIALPWLVDLTQLPLIWIQEPEDLPGDVNLLFQSKRRGRKQLGVSFCNHNPRLLWHRLDRLLVQWKAAKGKTLDGLVILRARAERTSEASEIRLAKLAHAGARVIRVEPQPLAEVAAYQAMLMAAQTGDLTRRGKPVDVGAYDDWVKATLSSAVKEFLDLVLEK